MDTITKFGLGLVALVALILGGIAYMRPVSTPPVGAVAGQDSFYPCETHNGVQRCFNQVGLTTATTTICAIKSPNATSTLVSAGLTFRVSTSTASTVTVARSSTAYATTSLIGSQLAIGANAQFSSAIASTTATNGGSTIFSPSTYMVIGMQGGLGGTFSPVGTCNATFEVIQ